MSQTRNIGLSILTVVGILLISTESKEVTIEKIFSNSLPIAKKLLDEFPLDDKVVKLWDYFDNTYQIIHPKSNSIAAISNKIDILSRKTDKVGLTIHDFRSRLFNRDDHRDAFNELEHKWETYEEQVKLVSNVYDDFIDHVENGTIEYESTRQSIVKNILEADPSLSRRLERIHELLYDENDYDNKTLLNYLINKTPHQLFMCRTSKSVQQFIYGLYRKLLENEVKSFGLIFYANSLRKAENPNVNTTVQERAAERFLNRMSNATIFVKRALEMAPREVLKCDPVPNKKEKDYVKFGPIFQKYVMHEHDSVKFWPIKTDLENRQLAVKLFHDHCNAEAMQNARDYSRKGYACGSRIRDCDYETRYFEICPLNRTGEKYERYRFVKGGGFGVFSSLNLYKAFDGVDEECNKSEMTPWGLIKLPRELSFNYSPYCENRICTCDDENEQLLRFFDLRWVSADEDKVITGLHMTRLNNTFYLKIKQGKMSQNGMIIGKSVWKEIDPFPTDFYMHRDYVEDIDYMRFTYDKKTIFLGNHDDPSKTKVLTGIRFSPSMNNTGIQLEAAFKQFDFATGSFTSTTNDTESLLDKPKNRKKIDLSKLDVPDNTNKNYENDYNLDEENSFLELTQTDLDLDFGQNILPFVDIQAVETLPPAPLSGVGLYRRATQGSGGYLALKLFTFDYASVLTTPNVILV